MLRESLRLKNKVGLFALVICNFVRMSIKKIFTFGRFNFYGVQISSLMCKFVQSDKGKIHIGNKSCILDNTLLDSCGGDITLSDNVFINRNCTIVSMIGINIDTHTSIGPNVCIYDHDHDLVNKGQFTKQKVEIGNNVWIGANATILKGVVIGNNCVIGAGSVVTHSIPSDSIAVGNPCKVIKSRL